MPDLGTPTAAEPPAVPPWGVPPPLSRTRLTAPADAPRPRRATYGWLAATVLVVLATVPAPPGVHWSAVGVLVAASVRSARPGAAQRSSRSAADLFPALALALVAAAALRSSIPMLTTCLLAASGLSAARVVDARRWPQLILAPVVLVRCAVQGVIWLGRPLRSTVRVRAVLPWLRGASYGLGLAIVVLALLRSADGAFAGLVERLVPDLALLSPARVVPAVMVALLTVALALGRVAPPNWSWLPVRDVRRPAAEWALPLALLDVVLVVFLLVQAAVLFDAYPDALVWGDLTPADRARQGFGQLVVVTLIITAALAWAGRRADPGNARHTLVLGAAGGTALLCALALVASALRRMWLYEQAFGWTVLRLMVGAFEIWLGAVLLLAGWAWLIRRTSVLPRLVTTSAGVALLALTLASPDALVARWNVDRYLRTGQFDEVYAVRLSADAAPEMARLPPSLRCDVLVRTSRRVATAEPWYAVNLARTRARHVIEDASCGERRAGASP